MFSRRCEIVGFVLVAGWLTGPALLQAQPGHLEVRSVALRAGTDEVPYLARVSTDGAIVYSGPGHSHYGTQKMQAGALVEVHRHDPLGWCAIRPPEDSFSLVLADDLELLGDGLARVGRDGIQCWVGTELGEVSEPLWQVRLRKGEVVEVLGEVDPASYQLDATDPRWVQITPPAGEFRWIHRDDLFDDQWAEPWSEMQAEVAPIPVLVDDKEDDITLARSAEDMQQANDDEPWPFLRAPQTPPGASLQASPTTQTNEHSAAGTAGQGAVYDEHSAAVPSRLQGPTIDTGVAGWRRAKQSAEQFVRDTMPPRWAANVDAGAIADQLRAQGAIPVDHPDQSATYGEGLVGQFSRSSSQPGHHTTAEAILVLDLHLTQQLLLAPEYWNLIPLANQASQILARAEDDLTRRQAAHFLSKIQRFQEIQANHRAAVAGGMAPRLAYGGPAAGTAAFLPSSTPAHVATTAAHQLPSSTSPGLMPNSQPHGEYDAVGVLNELVRAGGTQSSEFVLQDDQGHVTHHIAPAAGLNLHRYLKRRVGVIGHRGFHQHLNLPHITVERVIVLDRTPR